MRILVTGSNGFIGKNLKIHLNHIDNFKVLTFMRNETVEKLENKIKQSDFIIHLAAENRPKKDSFFFEVNIGLTKTICNILKKNSIKTPLIFSSSVQAKNHSLYGKSKLEAEKILKKLHKTNKNPIYIYRFQNVFGKWSKPNYNSVVATFCYNIINDIKIDIHDPKTSLKLVYIDDVVEEIKNILFKKSHIGFNELSIKKEYKITLNELAKILYKFKNNRKSLMIDSVGKGLIRALYSTYISFFKDDNFTYELPQYKDERGSFVEFLKTKQNGQISFLSAPPGVSRGKHYHHSKNEKFLILKGEARIDFKNITNNKKKIYFLSEKKYEVVDTIPGWAHKITNIGKTNLILLIWANELFDINKPDTFFTDMK